jgi:hypothetical protein
MFSFDMKSFPVGVEDSPDDSLLREVETFFFFKNLHPELSHYTNILFIHLQV